MHADARGVGPEISVCILSGHGPEAMEACLGSLSRQRAAPRFELLVGGDHTPAVLDVVRRYFPDSEVCTAEHRLPGAARNPLIERARGAALLFLDDDVTFAPDLLHRLSLALARHPEAAVFGGPNLTPPGSSPFQVVQGAALSSLGGAGPISRRYGARHAGPADERWFTLCNLAVRREAMVPFREDLVCAEENAVLAKLHRDGKRMRYEPQLHVFHERRPTWRSFAGQMAKYGRGRGHLIIQRPSAGRIPFLLPSALLAYLALLPGMLAAGADPTLISLPAAAYATVLLATGGKIAWTLRRPRELPRAVLLLLTIHVGYGAGVIRGLWSRPAASEAGAVAWHRIGRTVAPLAEPPVQSADSR